MDILEFDAPSFATSVAQKATAQLFGLLTSEEDFATPVDTWFAPELELAKDADDGARADFIAEIDGKVQQLGAYVCEHQVDQGERLFRWARSQQIAAGDWASLDLAGRLAFETFSDTCRRTFLSIRASQQAIEHARAQAGIKPPPAPDVEDTIFERTGGQLEREKHAIEVEGLNARYEREKAAEAKRLEQKARADAEAEAAAQAFNGADPAKFDHDQDGKPGGSKPKRKPARPKSKMTPPKPLSAGEAPAKPPVNRGGRGRKKTT